MARTALQQFSADFVVFYREGDGPTKDITNRYDKSHQPKEILLPALVTRCESNGDVEVVLEMTTDICCVSRSKVHRGPHTPALAAGDAVGVGQTVYINRPSATPPSVDEGDEARARPRLLHLLR